MEGYKEINLMERREKEVEKFQGILKRLISGELDPDYIKTIKCPQCNGIDWKCGVKRVNPIYSNKRPYAWMVPLNPSDPDTVLVAMDQITYLECDTCKFEVHEIKKVVFKEND